MSEPLVLILIPILLACVMLSLSTFSIQQHQRLVVLRFGKINALIGPGMSFIVPFIDIGIVVNLEKHVSGWQALSEAELSERVTQLIQANPNPKVYK
uniref:SPFH domain-containing protein n=1 Tax=Thaumasiovibrio occultus TaxID=1891184 RepID=UPI000B35AE5D|nr:SPFH domain-containing protein [Thaumasiovibrio occultus]